MTFERCVGSVLATGNLHLNYKFLSCCNFWSVQIYRLSINASCNVIVSTESISGFFVLPFYTNNSYAGTVCSTIFTYSPTTHTHIATHLQRISFLLWCRFDLHLFVSLVLKQINARTLVAMSDVGIHYSSHCSLAPLANLTLIRC